MPVVSGRWHAVENECHATDGHGSILRENAVSFLKVWREHQLIALAPAGRGLG